MLSLGSTSFSWVRYWPVCLLESSAVLAPCLLDGSSPCGASDSLPPPPFFPLPPIISHPLHSLCVCLALWYGSLLGTDQVYDPVSLNQKQGTEKRARDWETKCSFVKACSFVYCHNQCISIFRHIVWAKNVCFRVLKINSFTQCCMQPYTMVRVVNSCNLSVMSTLSINKIEQLKFPDFCSNFVHISVIRL